MAEHRGVDEIQPEPLKALDVAGGSWLFVCAVRDGDELMGCCVVWSGGEEKKGRLEVEEWRGGEEGQSGGGGVEGRRGSKSGREQRNGGGEE